MLSPTWLLSRHRSLTRHSREIDGGAGMPVIVVAVAVRPPSLPQFLRRPIMKRGFILVAMFAALALSARPAYAWDDFGHRLVARIAWENMTPHARARAIAILRGASHDTGLQGAVTGPLSERQQMELFVFAATWPDVVRDTAQSLRMEKYHHPTRHFLDTFWMQSTDFGPVQPSPLRSEGDLVRDVPRLNQWLVNGNAEQKALALAWLMHLVGDIHQPLHASGRVTPTEPCGDQGGNLF